MMKLSATVFTLLSAASVGLAFCPATTTNFGLRTLLSVRSDSCVVSVSSSTSVESDAPTNSNQAEYGKSLPLPNTYAKCGRCQASFALAADDLGANGKGCRVSCSLCGHSWFQNRERLYDIRGGFELIPLPQHQIDLVNKNIEAGRRPDFRGEAKMYVGNLNFGVTETDLIELFSKAGEVGEVSIARDDQGRNRGFAFITMMTKEGGEKGLELDGEELMGRSVNIRPPNN